MVKYPGPLCSDCLITIYSLSFHGPFWALVNLALHVIEYPGEATVQSDLALLDMGAAHFARVEFATGFTNNLPRTIANLARTSVQRHRIMLSSQPDWNEGACVVEPGLEGIYSSQEQFDMSHIGQFAYQPVSIHKSSLSFKGNMILIISGRYRARMLYSLTMV